MKTKLDIMMIRLFAFLFTIGSVLIVFHTDSLYALENDNSVLIKKVSQSYAKKFCNSIGFGLSKESSMNFSMEENKQVFKKKKGINDIDKELLSEEIAILVIDKCGYPMNLSGEKGIMEFKNYYLAKDKESSEK